MLEGCAWRCVGGSGRPLCSRYHVVVLQELIVLLQAEKSPALTLQWALGASVENHREVLGLWPTEQVAPSAWREICKDLVIRGVERIDFLTRGDASAVQAMPFEASALTVDTQVLRFAKVTATTAQSRKRRMAHSCQAQAVLMQAELERSLRRHGPFDSTAAACTFGQAALVRLERRFWADDPGAQPAHRRAPAPHSAAFS